MAWIESHENLGQHPKVYALCTALNGDMPTSIGVLHLLWHFTLKFAWRDGDLSRFTPQIIARSIGWRKAPEVLIKALQETGWLDDMKVHDWLEYAGKIVRDRIYNVEKRRKTPLNDELPRKTAATVPYRTVPNNNTPLPPKKGGECTIWFNKIWLAYPATRRHGKAVALKRFLKSVKTLEDAKRCADALERYLNTETAQNGYLLRASKWFNEWEDHADAIANEGNSERIFSSDANGRGNYKSPRSREQASVTHAMLGTLADSKSFGKKIAADDSGDD